MVTYCLYAVLGALSTYNLFQGRPLTALFYALLIAVSVWFDRKTKKDTEKFEAEMAATEAKRVALLAKMDQRRAEDQKRFDDAMAEAAAVRDRFMTEHYVGTVLVKRSDFLPLTEDREASLRAKFDEAASQCLHNLLQGFDRASAEGH